MKRFFITLILALGIFSQSAHARTQSRRAAADALHIHDYAINSATSEEMKKESVLENKESEISTYLAEDGRTKIDVHMDGDTVFKERAKYSHDELHVVPKDVSANDGYRDGKFDELHVNSNYAHDIWHPDDRGFRFDGFDELRFADEL